MFRDSLAKTPGHPPKDDPPRVSYKDQMRENNANSSSPPPVLVAVDAKPVFGSEEEEEDIDAQSRVPITDAVPISPSRLQRESQEERDHRIQQLERRVDHLQQGQGAKKKYQTAVLCALGAVALLGIIAAAGTCGSGKCRRRSSPKEPTAVLPAMLLSRSPTPAPTRLVWEQVGDDLIGVEVHPGGYGDGGLFGSAVSFSSDGSILAVGFGEEKQFAFFRARALGANSYVYVAKLYNCSATDECVEIGSIDNPGYDWSSAYISLSVAGDGSRVAVAYGNIVNVYATNSLALVGPMNSTFWQSQDTNQTVVSLSNTGDILAVLQKSGAVVEIYEYQMDGDIWQQLGAAILRLGHQEVNRTITELQSLSLSSDGNVVAIGANFVGARECPGNIVEGLDYFGINVRVFAYAPSSGNWTQIGPDIEREEYESLYSDQTISLNADGTIIAIGSSARNPDDIGCGAYSVRRKDTGRVRVFQLVEGSWVPRGGTLSGGMDAGDLFGVSVSLSDDGMKLVIGSSSDGGNGLESGTSRVYEYIGDDWVQLGPDVVGAAGDNLGTSVAISGDGRMIAVGVPKNTAKGSDTGTARVFNLGGSPA
jgi:FG-GAP repeat